MAMVVDIYSHVTTRHGNCLQHRDTFYNLERCFVVDIGIYCNEMFVGDAAMGASRDGKEPSFIGFGSVRVL